MHRPIWRHILASALTLAGACSAVIVIAALLQAALAAGGDATGAQAIQGVTLVSLFGLLISLFTLLIALAVLELVRE